MCRAWQESAHDNRYTRDVAKKTQAIKATGRGVRSALAPCRGQWIPGTTRHAPFYPVTVTYQITYCTSVAGVDWRHDLSTL